MTVMTLSSSLPESSFRARVFGFRPFQTDGELLALRFAPDGSLWSVEEPGVLRHWDVSSGQQMSWHELADPSAVWCFSGAAHYLASGSAELSLWETKSGGLLSWWPQASWVTALAFQAGGLLLASGHDDGRVRLWDYAGGRLVYELPAPISPSGGGGDLAVSALAFSVDGRKLAVAAEDRSISLWNLANGEMLGRLLGHTDRIPALAWHPDGRRLVSAGWDATARVWDTAVCQPLILLNDHADQVQALAFAPGGQHLASVDSAHLVHLWEMDSYRTLAVQRDHAYEVNGLAFAPHGQCLASGGAGRVIHLWHAPEWNSSEYRVLSTESRDPELKSQNCLRTCLAVSDDGRRLASLGTGTALRVWNTATAEPLLELEDAPLLRAFAASPDGHWFAGSVARPQGLEDDRSTLFLWRADNGRREKPLSGQVGPITVLAFSADSRLLATAGLRSGDVWLWSIPDGEPLLLPDVVEGCSIEALAFHPHERLLAVGGINWLAPHGAEGRIVLWDMPARRAMALLPGGTNSLTFHPSGRYLAVATQTPSVLVWDMESQQQVNEWPGHLDAVTCLAYSPDGRWLASGSDDRTLRLWDADTGQPGGLVELDTQIKALAFALDGRSLFTGNATTSCYQIDVRQILSAD
jgi:WD40 repeat protein